MLYTIFVANERKSIEAISLFIAISCTTFVLE